MFLQYGSYKHDVGECAINRTRTSEYNERNQRWGIRERWSVTGMLANPTGDLAVMKSKLQALESAYSVEGKDLVLCFDTGAHTSHALYSAGAIGGTKISQPISYPNNSGASGITYTDYTFAVEAFFLTGESSLVSFQESLSFSGGGAVYGHIETLRGRPIKQLRRRHSLYRVTQQGQAVGLSAYPTIPRPLWPADQMLAVSEDRQSPQYRDGDYINYPISWRYEFESAFRMIGNPNTR